MVYASLVILAIALILGVLGQSTKDIGDLYRVNHLVPDLIPVFQPTVLLQVTFENILIPGQILSQNGKTQTS